MDIHDALEPEIDQGVHGAKLKRDREEAKSIPDIRYFPAESESDFLSTRTFDLPGDRDLASPFDHLLQLALEMTGAEGGALLLQEKEGIWWVAAARGDLGKYLHCRFSSSSWLFPRETASVAGESAKSREDNALGPWGRELHQDHHFLLVPVPVPEMPPAYLELIRRKDRGDFGEKERREADLFARRAGIPISLALRLAWAEENRLRLEAVLDSIGEGVLALDEGGRLIFSNPSSQRMLGLAPIEKYVGSDLDGLPVDISVRDALLRSLRERRERAELIRLPDQGRILQLETRLFHAPGEPSPGLVAVMRDVTAEKELERMREEFVSTLSHELRTPLTSIKAYAATLLRQDVDFDQETQREFLAIIEGEADRLARLIRDLLDTSRAESGRLQLRTSDVDISSLLESVLEKMKTQAGSHHLRLEPLNGPIPVRADPDRIEQVITNLLDNALKYSPAGTTITLSVRIADREVVVGVSDQGIGIPEEHQPHVFEKFHRVQDERSRHVQGTGLGLYLCRKIVEAHGGRIWLESKPGQGSTFLFSLPLAGTGNWEASMDAELVDLNG